MQLGLVAGNNPVADADGLLTRLGALISRARALGIPIVYVLDDDVGEVGTREWDVHPAIAPQADDVRVRKHACDAFHETELKAILVARDIGHLVIGGCKTEYCIDTTCRAAISHGYPVSLVGDGHSTTNSPVLPAAQIISHHNQVLNGFGGYYERRVCEIVVAPGANISFDGAKDVPSSLEVRSS